MATLQASDLTLAYDKVTIVDELSLDIPTGQVSIVVGANGCGKSTSAPYHDCLSPPAGAVGRGGYSFQAGQGSRKDFGSVATVTNRAGWNHRPRADQPWTLPLTPGLFKRFSAEDEAAVNHAMEMTGTTELADRAVDELWWAASACLDRHGAGPW